MTPAFYNAHSHCAMNLMRGYGENLPLQEWLQTKTFPFEAHLTLDDVYLGTMAAVAEMLDAFWSSESQVLILDGSRVLPSPGHMLKVGSHTVVLESGSRSSTAFTRCASEFELRYGETVEVWKDGPRTPRRCGGRRP